MKALVVFLGAAALDFVWAWYIQATAGKWPLGAATLSAVIALLGGVLCVEYVGNHWMLVPMAAGCFAGTWLKVSRGE